MNANVKKNKYCWRELKDEKPEVGEFIFLSCKSEHPLLRFPRIVKYNGTNGTESLVISPQDIFDNKPCSSVLNDAVLWYEKDSIPGGWE